MPQPISPVPEPAPPREAPPPRPPERRPPRRRERAEPDLVHALLVTFRLAAVLVAVGLQ